MSIKFRVLGGCFGGKCRFYFYGRADFSENHMCENCRPHGTLYCLSLLVSNRKACGEELCGSIRPFQALFHPHSDLILIKQCSEPPKGGRKNGAARKLSKSVEKLFDTF